MKHLKKLGSVLLALVMVLALAAPAFAADAPAAVDHEIKFEGKYVEGYTYKVYELFTGKENSAGNLVDIQWGSQLQDEGKQVKFIDILKNNNSELLPYLDDLSDATIKSNPGAVAVQLDAARAKLGSDKVGKMIVAVLSGTELNLMDASDSSNPKTLDPNKEGGEKLKSGWYLFVGQSNVQGSEPFYNLYQVTKDVTIAPKGSDNPELDKKVNKKSVEATGSVDLKDTNLGEWKDAADFNIGDTVAFKIEAKLPDTFTRLTEYEMLFTDKQDDGLTMVEGSLVVEMVALDADGNEQATLKATDFKTGDDVPEKRVDGTTNAQDASATFQVYIENARRSGCEYVKFTTDNSDCTFMMRITYKATLTGDSVVIGNGQTPSHGNLNKITLDSYWNGTGKRQEDETPVYTFKFDVDKIDGDRKNPVFGADFALYQWTGDTAPTSEQLDSAWDATNETAATGWKNITKLASAPADPKKVDKDGNVSYFEYKGLEAGYYMLVETDTPDGYTGLAGPVYFQLVADYNDTNIKSEADCVVKSLKLVPFKQVDKVGGTEGEKEWVLDETLENQTVGTVTNGTVILPVVNKQGTLLPETGGIGTTIFYIVGGVLVLGAVVLLITKRRTSVDDE